MYRYILILPAPCIAADCANACQRGVQPLELLRLRLRLRLQLCQCQRLWLRLRLCPCLSYARSISPQLLALLFCADTIPVLLDSPPVLPVFAASPIHLLLVVGRSTTCARACLCVAVRVSSASLVETWLTLLIVNSRAVFALGSYRVSCGFGPVG